MPRTPKSEKQCIECGKTGIVERKRCKECAKEYNRKRAKERYSKYGRYNFGKSTCPVCNKEMTLWRRNQASHIECRHKVVDDYNAVSRNKFGTATMARQIVLDLGIYIPENYVVHHVDENPENNALSNLLLLPNNAHCSLHRKLQYHRSLWLKDQSKYPENCWNILRDHLTTTWLETTDVTVIKIGDIGQSAAEPLNSEITEHEEGSETMHGNPKSQSDKDKI
jgi:hypothetical protein